MLCVRNSRDRCWRGFGNRSKQHASRHCLRVHWPGPATTPSLGEKLTWFLEYPELELSNNLAENSMHLVAIGRKNWIHIGSQQAGPKVAAILSVVESCRRLRLAVRNYVAVVLPGFTDLPIPRLPTYLRCLGSPASVVIDPVPAYPHMPNPVRVPSTRFSILYIVMVITTMMGRLVGRPQVTKHWGRRVYLRRPHLGP
jgi:hypothetical protein